MLNHVEPFCPVNEKVVKHVRLGLVQKTDRPAMVAGEFHKRAWQSWLTGLDCLDLKPFEQRKHRSKSCDIDYFFGWNFPVVFKIFHDLWSIVISQLIQIFLLYFVLGHFWNLQQLNGVNLVEKLEDNLLKVTVVLYFLELVLHQMKNRQTNSKHNFDPFYHDFVPQFEQQLLSKLKRKQTREPRQCDWPDLELTLIEMVH